MASTTWRLRLVGRQVPDELDVDLELGDRQLLEVDEAPEPGAEVIDGQAHIPEPPDPGRTPLLL